MPPVKAEPKPRRSVLLIGSEARPFSKTGGLADVLGALPPALQRLGWDATVALPRYRGVSAGTLVDTFAVTVGGYTRDTFFYDAPLADGARALLIDCPDLYDRPGLYGVDNTDYPDNARRFAFLARAALEYAARREIAPSIVHAHDWQAALAPVYLRTVYAAHPVLGGTPSVFTIHNLAYQGIFEPDWLPRLDLGWEQFAINRLEFYGRISFLKGGINDARTITTVSRRYAEEIQTPAFGFGFDGILRAKAADLAGILNGIDTSEWDPARDPFLPRPFDAGDLAGKRDAKAALLGRYGLSTDQAAMTRPLIGMVSRMVDQKGFDLIAATLDDLVELDAAFVILGTGEPRYQDMWRAIAARYPDRVGALIGFDESLAHLIEGGSDLFLMPSRFEPCGLNQMYSMRYGTVPVVNGVGGLADTVVDYSARSRQSTGFVLADYTPPALLEALHRAFTVFTDRRRWQALQATGMLRDFSWDRSAQEVRQNIRTRSGWGRGLGPGGLGDTMAAENVQTFTDGNFDDSVLKSGAPVMVDFWAEWCGPCKRLGPTVDALASEYAGKVTVGKMNIDENPKVPEIYQIRGIPTILIFKGGQVVESIVGLSQKEDLKKVLDKLI